MSAQDRLALVRLSVDVRALRALATTDEHARLVLADAHEESGHDRIAELLRCSRLGPGVAAGLGRPDVMRMWLDELPIRKHVRKRVVKITADEAGRSDPWVKRWVEIGLATAPADRPLFEAAASACYRYSGLQQPRFAWCESPIVAVMAGSVWAARGSELVHSHVHSQVHSQVGSHVNSHVHSQVGSQVHSQVNSQVHSHVGSQVHSQVYSQLSSNAHAFSDDEIEAIRQNWPNYFGGQFWVGWGWGGWWGSAAVAFVLDVLRLDIGRDMELRARAYAATAKSACWWYPCADVVFVSERPHRLERNIDGKLKLASWDGWEV